MVRETDITAGHIFAYNEYEIKNNKRVFGKRVFLDVYISMVYSVNNNNNFKKYNKQSILA